jgi:hypothetical protein
MVYNQVWSSLGTKDLVKCASSKIAKKKKKHPLLPGGLNQMNNCVTEHGINLQIADFLALVTDALTTVPHIKLQI